MELITLQNGQLTVVISRVGAEMTSVRDKDGVERLWQGSPDFWSKHAPILFPVPGALKDDAYLLDGKRFSLAKHGFARERTFSVETQRAASVTLALEGEASYHTGFPFRYVFRVRFTLEGSTVCVDYDTENLDERPFWFGVGSHEAYVCPEGIEAYEIVFDKPETLAHNVLSGSLLTGETQVVAANCTVLPLRQELFANDSLVFTAHKSRSVTLRSALHNRRIRVDFDDFGTLLLWTPKGAPFICIEPWTNPPDRVDADQDITKKPGMIRLAPGERRARSHTIAFI